MNGLKTLIPLMVPSGKGILALECDQYSFFFLLSIAGEGANLAKKKGIDKGAAPISKHLDEFSNIQHKKY